MICAGTCDIPECTAIFRSVLEGISNASEYARNCRLVITPKHLVSTSEISRACRMFFPHFCMKVWSLIRP